MFLRGALFLMTAKVQPSRISMATRLQSSGRKLLSPAASSGLRPGRPGLVSQLDPSPEQLEVKDSGRWWGRASVKPPWPACSLLSMLTGRLPLWHWRQARGDSDVFDNLILNGRCQPGFPRVRHECSVARTSPS